MKVKCIKKTTLQKSITNPPIQEVFEHSIQMNTVYTVYSIKIWNKEIKYLLTDQHSNPPLWYPAELFEITDHTLPSSWYYTFNGYDIPLHAIWGYKELVFSLEHYDDLIELEPKALEIFYKRKIEIDSHEKESTY